MIRSFTNGLPELLILRKLSAGEMYGYQLVGEIAKAGEGLIKFSEGCVYPVLHRLESKGILATREEQIGGRLRRYYRLSQPGKKRLAQLMDELQTVNRTVEIIGGQVHAL